MLGGPAGLPGNVVRGNTIFCLTHVDDRAYYIPRGYKLKDRIYCWRVKADRETGRIFYVNCGGLGESWALPDLLADNYDLRTQALDGSPRCFSSLSGLSPTARQVASEDAVAVLEAAAAVAVPSVELSNEAKQSRDDDTIFSLTSPSASNVCHGTREKTFFLASMQHSVADIYLNDITYLRSFDAEVQAPASAATTVRGEPDGARMPCEGSGAEFSPLEAQLRRQIEDYAEEVATLRQKLAERERILMEKDLALLELEERMVNMRLRMLKAVSAHRKATFP
ncbi:hypothetical protein TraAM80_03768 [Trypanosoma rangeli]|uniref:WW domain-containing protein n=1 Tax=Trypanosoma rangeli TaxID=5698 RepID=A0A3R7MQW5_TRYRA|nr:uncharacterized protein TraAM80_03768 [Trypanosoma rangeli]RNF06745.1 hypothetical protein TraAM80_03768 [Trypanosoma rangeli]|eukprot:RNF06745.1 hypothetical protein TraAM80_03768 [Trypanosoma rangeli]